LKLLPRILAEEDEEERASDSLEIDPEPAVKPFWWGWSVALAVAAAIPRPVSYTHLTLPTICSV